MNGVGGNYQLTTNLELGATRTLTLTNGTFDFNGRLVAGSTPNITVLTGNSTVVNTTGNANITVAIPFVHTSGNLSLGANLTVNNASGYTFTAGNLNLGSNTLTTRTFVSTGAGARTLGFGTGKISLNANANATIWNTDTNMAVSGTPVVETLGGGTTVTKVITTGAASSANSISWRFYESNGSVTYTLTNLNAFRDLTVDGLQTINPGNITVYGNFSHTNANGTTTFGASANVWTFSGSGNKTIATLTGTTYDFPWTFDGTGGNWQLLNNVSLGSTRIFTLANGNVDFNNYSLTQTSTQGITIAGGATGVASIFNTANGNNFTTAQPFTHSNGTFNLSGNVTSSNATGYTLLGGTLNLSTSALTVPSFSSSTTGARTIAFGTGKIVLNTSSGGTIWNTGTSTSLTVTGTPVVECLGGGTSITKTITPSTTLSEANTIGFSLLDNSATVTYSFTGSSVIRDLRLNGTQSLTFATLNIYGNLSHESAGTTIPANNTPWVFAATTGNRTINNLSGFTYDFPWTFGSATSTAAWTLQNDLILGSSATRALTFANGITDFNNKNISGNFSVTIAGGTPTLRDTGGSEVDFLNKPITHSTGNITLTANVRTSNTYTLTAGNIILGANSSSGNALIVDSFSSTGTGVRGINWIAPSSALYVTGNNATIFTIGVATNFTTTGVPYVVSNYSGATGTRSFVTGFSEAQAANWNVSVNGSSGLVFNAGGGTDTVSLAGNYNDINYTGLNCNIAHAGTFLYGNLTLPATGGNFAGGVNATTFLGTANRTITTNGRFYDNPIAVSKTGASLQMVDSVNIGSRTLTLNSGTLDLNNNTFTANDLSSTNSNTRALTFGTSGVITLSGSSGSVVNFTTMTGFTYAGTPRIYSTYSGGTGIRAFNFGSTAGHTPTNVMDMSFGTSGTGLVITSGTDTLDLLGGFNNVNFTGWTQGSLATSARTIYGNLTTSANATALGSGVSLTTMAGNGTQLITTNGRVIGFPIAVGNGTSNGTVRLADAYTSGSNIGNPPQLVSGTLDLNNFVFTANSFTSNGSNIRTLAFGSSGQLVLSGNSNTMADFTTMTNFVYTGTPYINSTYTGSTGTRTFIFGSSGGANPTNIFDVSRTGANGLILGTGTDSVALTGSFGDVNLSGLTQTLTNTTRTIFGNFTVPATGGTLTSGASTTNLAAPFIPVANGYSAYYVLNNNLFVSGLPFPTNGPFTVECWVNIFAMSATFSWAVSQTTNSQTFGLGVTTSGTKLKCAFAHPNLNIQSVALLDYNTWHHIAVSRDSANTFRMFVNGNLDTTSNSFTAAIIPQANCRIGGGFAGITEMYQGYITNVRVNNTAVYTASFTPPTSPLTSISGTTLLAVQNTQFVDNGPSNLTISAGATIAQNSPFAGGVSTTKTIVTNGRSLDFPINIGSFVSAPGINQLSGALTLGTANQSISLTTGTLDLNNFTLTAYNFGSSTTANRTLDFKSSGQIVLTAGGAGGGGVTVINMPTASEFRLAGNPQVRCTYNAGFNLRTFSLGNTAGFTIANVANSDNMFNFNFNGSNGIILSTSTDALVIQGQFRDFDLRNTTNSINNAVRTVYGNFYTSATGGTIQAGASAQTMAGYSGNFIIDTANRLVDFPLTINGNGNFSFSNSYNMGGRTATLTAGNVTLNNVSLFCAAFVTNGNSIRSLNFTGTTGAINLSANGATIWNSNNGANFSMSGNIIINSTYASNLGTRVFDFGNIAESSAPNVKITTGTVGFNIGTANDSVTLTGSIGDLNLTGLLATVTNSSRTVYGNITIPATGGAFTAGTTATVLGSTSGTKTIDTANRALAFPLTFNGVGGNWTLANGLNANATTVLTLANGRVNFNQQPLTFANITIAGGATGNAGLSNLNTTLAMVHTSGNLTIVSGAINSATTNSYTLTSGTLNVASSFSTGAFTNNGGNIIL
jgi:hypothetical protein